jgi:hypothetical protein
VEESSKNEQLERFRRALERKAGAAKEASEHPHHDKAPGKVGHVEPAHARDPRPSGGGGERGV